MKKNVLFCLSFFAFNLTKAENFTPTEIKFTCTIHAKEADLEQLQDRLILRSTNSNAYQSLMVIIQELQAAFTAGLNFFVTASTGNESAIQIVEELAADALLAQSAPADQMLGQIIEEEITASQAASSAATTPESSTTKAVEPTAAAESTEEIHELKLSIISTVNNAEELKSWVEAKELFLFWADKINNHITTLANGTQETTQELANDASENKPTPETQQ